MHNVFSGSCLLAFPGHQIPTFVLYETHRVISNSEVNPSVSGDNKTSKEVSRSKKEEGWINGSKKTQVFHLGDQ